MDPYFLLEKYIRENKELCFTDFYIFEAGFGYDLGYLFDLYHRYPFRKYLGVESEPENSVTISYTDGSCIRRSGPYCMEDLYEKYRIYFQNSKFKKPLSRKHFYDMVELKFETSIEDFIQVDQVDEKFNLGVFSKLFHKFSSKRIPIKIVDWFCNNSKSDALLLITIMNSEKYAVKNIDFKYSVKDIEELINSINFQLITRAEDESFLSMLLRKD